MSEDVIAVSFEDCLHELIDAGGSAAKQEYRLWRSRSQNRPGYDEVISFVESFTHRFLYEITEEMLEDAKAGSVLGGKESLSMSPGCKSHFDGAS